MIGLFIGVIIGYFIGVLCKIASYDNLSKENEELIENNRELAELYRDLAMNQEIIIRRLD